MVFGFALHYANSSQSVSHSGWVLGCDNRPPSDQFQWSWSMEPLIACVRIVRSGSGESKGVAAARAACLRSRRRGGVSRLTSLPVVRARLLTARTKRLNGFLTAFWGEEAYEVT